ncbi:GNAT family N-acetyltransferase [Massilia sp. GCM10023247]|uniref:GNAT family N-acetyltransferase n=1 Tax=Massilia sp. GCM10023247 TaxID=3252643 RepID=UPI00361BE176
MSAPSLHFLVRPELPSDVADIDSVQRAAFSFHPHSNQTEHLIVRRLRTGGRLALSLVAETREGAIVGHAAFSPVTIDGQALDWMGLGPLAVLPGSQGMGAGSALVHAGLAALADRGAAGCVVFGEPGYYGRFGFQTGSTLRYPGAPGEYFLALALDGKPLPSGDVAYDPAFD